MWLPTWCGGRRACVLPACSGSYLKFLGGTEEVDDLTGLSPSNHGTSNPGALFAEGALGCVSCGQPRTGSAFLAN
jgi:hypothetical protein